MSLDDFDFEIYYLKVPNSEMVSDHYTILVENYAFGQFRIRITDLRMKGCGAPSGHGHIVQEL